MSGHFKTLPKDKLREYQKKAVQSRNIGNAPRWFIALAAYQEGGIELVEEGFNVKQRQAYNLVKKGRDIMKAQGE